MSSFKVVGGCSANGTPMRAIVLIVGALHLAAGAFMFLSPRGFYDRVGTFPPFNAHYLRDLATWYLAFGVALLLAARRPAWRVPLLALAVLQYALHVVNHVIDISDPEPAWKGPATVIALAVIGVALALLGRRASEAE